MKHADVISGLSKCVRHQENRKILFYFYKKRLLYFISMTSLYYSCQGAVVTSFSQSLEQHFKPYKVSRSSEKSHF